MGKEWEEGGGKRHYFKSYGAKASTDDTTQEDECQNRVSSQGESVWV
mgnify:CR=1 FL=1